MNEFYFLFSNNNRFQQEIEQKKFKNNKLHIDIRIYTSQMSNFLNDILRD